MKILSITLKEHFVPNCSCGTGYSEPDIFIVETDIVTKDVYVDVWYRDKEDYYKIFVEAIHNQFEDCYKHFEGQIDTKIRNIDEAYQMYLEAIKKRQYMFCKKYNVKLKDSFLCEECEDNPKISTGYWNNCPKLVKY